MRQPKSCQRVRIPDAGSTSKLEGHSRNQRANKVETNKIVTEAISVTVESEKNNVEGPRHKAKTTKTAPKYVRFALQRKDVSVLSITKDNETANPDSTSGPATAETNGLRLEANSRNTKEFTEYEGYRANSEHVQTHADAVNASLKIKNRKVKGIIAENSLKTKAENRVLFCDADKQIRQSDQQNHLKAYFGLESRVLSKYNASRLSQDTIPAMNEAAASQESVFVESDNDQNVCENILHDITLLDTAIEQSQNAKREKRKSKLMNAKKHEEHLRKSKEVDTNDRCDEGKCIASASSMEEIVLTKSNCEADEKSKKKLNIKKPKERSLKLGTNATTTDEACNRNINDTVKINADRKRVNAVPKEKLKNIYKAFEDQEEIMVDPKGMTESSMHANAACTIENNSPVNRITIDNCSSSPSTSNAKNAPCSSGDTFLQLAGRKPLFKKAAPNKPVPTVRYPLSDRTDLNVCFAKNDEDCSIRANGCNNWQEPSLASSSGIAQKKKPIFQMSRKTLGVRNVPNVTD